MWGDKAHVTLLGYEGNVSANNIIRNVVFQNIDVINHVENGAEWQGVIAMMCTGNQTIRDITYQDIRIMSVQNPATAKIVHFDLNPGYSTNYQGKAIRNVVIRNVSYAGTGESQSIITGLNATTTVDSVQFINYTRNGTLVTNAQNGNLSIGANAFHITFSGPQVGTGRPALFRASENAKEVSYAIFDAAGHIYKTVFRVENVPNMGGSALYNALPAGIFFTKAQGENGHRVVTVRK